jgi:5-methylcytosine-specific restriction protein A
LGEITTRTELAQLYGGSVFSGGIVPANKSGNVFVFSDPEAGEEFGYTFDGLNPDEDVFYYTGHGPTGDHEIADRNLSVARHVEDGRSLRLFVADGYVGTTKTRRQKYIGEYQIDPINPHRREPGKDKNGATRTVLVFRLIPVNDVLHTELRQMGLVTSTTPLSGGSLLVPKEVDSTYYFPVKGTDPSVASKIENTLVSKYEAFRGVRNAPMQRWAIRVPGEDTRLLTDIYDASTTTLFEAKASSERNSVRLAIGQLLDYRRHIPVSNLHSALLLPSLPTPDLQNLIAGAGLGLVYSDPTGGFKASSVYRQHIRGLAGLTNN